MPEKTIRLLYERRKMNKEFRDSEWEKGKAKREADNIRRGMLKR